MNEHSTPPLRVIREKRRAARSPELGRSAPSEALIRLVAALVVADGGGSCGATAF